MDKIKNFTDLNAWKEGHKLVLSIYALVKGFPSSEKFILSSQILRAIVSVTSNIAEGFGRKNIKEKIQFYYMGQASLVEVQNQLLIARDLHYISSGVFEKVWEQTIITHRLISGLIRSLKKGKASY